MQENDLKSVRYLRHGSRETGTLTHELVFDSNGFVQAIATKLKQNAVIYFKMVT